MVKGELENLFLNVLPVYYGWTKKVDTIATMWHIGAFVFHDEKACNQCVVKGNECNSHEVAKYESENEVCSVDIEAYLDVYARSYKLVRGVRCDFLHFDMNNEKFVLNELTCSRKKFVEPYTNSKGVKEGKREHARRQMENVACILCNVPELNECIQGFKQRVALFSWRNRSKEETIKTEKVTKAEEAMSLFLEPLETVADIREMADLSNNFRFVQQLYPAPFIF